MKNTKNNALSEHASARSLVGSLATFDVLLEFVESLRRTSHEAWDGDEALENYKQANDIVLDSVRDWALSGRQRIVDEIEKLGLEIPRARDDEEKDDE